MPGSSETVFVYGTLRRGGSNHHRLHGAEFIAMATLRGRLYRIDWYPGLVADGNSGEVTGEIHHVPASLLAALDDYEGPEYRRVRMAVRPSQGTVPECHAWVWLWNGPVDETRRIANGDWLAVT
jgi:gamma-glutamylcyclotransferase (GGCT)/AIG2-like uncharacterized protein YtfP